MIETDDGEDAKRMAEVFNRQGFALPEGANPLIQREQIQGRSGKRLTEEPEDNTTTRPVQITGNE